VLGLTLAQIEEARAKGQKPALGAGFAYLRGPDDAIVEYQGNMPAERFNHIAHVSGAALLRGALVSGAFECRRSAPARRRRAASHRSELQG
jgi:hypothetical protein